MLPLEILLSSIDIGVDRVGSRLPLQVGVPVKVRLDWIPPIPTIVAKILFQYQLFFLNVRC